MEFKVGEKVQVIKKGNNSTKWGAEGKIVNGYTSMGDEVYLVSFLPELLINFYFLGGDLRKVDPRPIEEWE